MVDELLVLRNNLFLGNYNECITQAAEVLTDDEKQKLELRVIELRAQIGLGETEQVLEDLEVEEKKNNGLKPQLQGVKILAEYTELMDQALQVDDLENIKSKKSDLLQQLDEYMNDPSKNQNKLLLTIAATIYNMEGKHMDALRCVHGPTTLEMHAIQIATYLFIDREDLAVNALKKMVDMSDVSSITQYTKALVHIKMGEIELVEEEYAQLLQLSKKYGNTITILNLMAAALALQEKYEEAEKILLKALTKNSKHPETIINLMVVQDFRGKAKNDVYSKKLQKACPNHPWLKSVQEQESIFDEQAARFLN